MFTAALIAGQARANLPASESVETEFGPATEISINLDARTWRQLESLPLPVVLDALRALPIDIEFGADEVLLSIGSDSDADADDAPLR